MSVRLFDRQGWNSSGESRPDDSERRGRMTPAQQRLTEEYLPMAVSWAKPFKRGWPQAREEFHSAACLALVEAAVSFDPNRGVKFATYARFRIIGALRDVQNDLRHAYKVDGDEATRLMGLRGDPEECGKVMLATFDTPVGHEMETEEFVHAWLGRLPAKHAQTCREIYVNGKNQEQAAKSVGCSKSRLSTLHKEAIDLIRESWDTRVAMIERPRTTHRFD